jgi:ABC-2 type transport system ATP-binding protein
LEQQTATDSVEVKGRQLRVLIKTNVEDYSDLASALISSGIRIRKFAEEEINLESAFMAFTKGAGAKI